MRTLAKSKERNILCRVIEGVKRKRKRERRQQQLHPMKHLPLCSWNDEVLRRERGSRYGTLVILILSRKWTNRLATKIHRNRMHPLQSSTSHQMFFMPFRFYSTAMSSSFHLSNVEVVLAVEMKTFLRF